VASQLENLIALRPARLFLMSPTRATTGQHAIRGLICVDRIVSISTDLFDGSYGTHRCRIVISFRSIAP
jgi:hypothetical protein